MFLCSACCLCLIIHRHTTALVVFNLLRYVRTAHHSCEAQSVAQDTEQKHDKHGSGALMSSFLLLLVAVLAGHGGCLSSVDRDRGLRIWNEREARRNECETRGTAYLEQAGSTLERV